MNAREQKRGDTVGFPIPLNFLYKLPRLFRLRQHCVGNRDGKKFEFRGSVQAQRHFAFFDGTLALTRSGVGLG